MTNIQPALLSKAVAAICPDIQSRIEHAATPTEAALWWELSCCILSSQVPYPLAVAAANAIESNGALIGKIPTATLVSELTEVLRAPLSVEGKTRYYRFPESRAEYLARTKRVITSSGGSIRKLLNSFEHVHEARSWLVKNLVGIGPKQASMFLRNTGISYDIAILDRHVLKYMYAQGIYSEPNFVVPGLTAYRHHEAALKVHAKELACPVGLLDWAIWIVMRVANRQTGAASQ